jgi:hypothetical protein
LTVSTLSGNTNIIMHNLNYNTVHQVIFYVLLHVYKYHTNSNSSQTSRIMLDWFPMKLWRHDKRIRQHYVFAMCVWFNRLPRPRKLMTQGYRLSRLRFAWFMNFIVFFGLCCFHFSICGTYEAMNSVRIKWMSTSSFPQMTFDYWKTTLFTQPKVNVLSWYLITSTWNQRLNVTSYKMGINGFSQITFIDIILYIFLML